jgi:hypothetical protein
MSFLHEMDMRWTSKPDQTSIASLSTSRIIPSINKYYDLQHTIRSPGTLNTTVVASSYLIVGGSVGLIVLSLFLQGALGYGYSPFGFFPGTILTLVGVGGLVLGPYFGLAGFIAKENSVWFEANRMIHHHISFPILGGLALYFGSFSYFFFPALTAYVVVVLLGTLISVMASKTSKPAGHSQETAKN